MPLSNPGRDHIAGAVVGAAVTPFNAANARIGVGNSNTAFAASQTDLQGASKFRKGMEASYPVQSANELVFRATFGTEEANFAWLEWGVFNAASGGTMLNRALESLGTKTSAQTWQLTTTLTFATA